MAYQVLSAGKEIQMEIWPVRHQEYLKNFPKAMLTNSRFSCLSLLNTRKCELWSSFSTDDCHFPSWLLFPLSTCFLPTKSHFLFSISYILLYPQYSGEADSFVMWKQSSSQVRTALWIFLAKTASTSANVWWTEGEILQCLLQIHFWTGIH